MKRHIVSFVLVAVAATLSCKNDTNVPPAVVVNEVLPLATGNSWNFLRTWIDTTGVPVYASTLLMTVGQAESFEAEKVYPVSDFPIVFVNPEPLLCANRPGGLYNAVPGTDRGSPAFVRVLTFPTVVGDSVLFYGHIIRTASVNDQVVVPAGSFTCIRYDIYQSDTIRAWLFVAPKIGIVLCWQKYHAFSVIVDELQSFQLRD